MRILGTEPSSVSLAKESSEKVEKSDAQKYQIS